MIERRDARLKEIGVALLFGILPGLVWWFWAMQQDTHQVALTKDHGYPERILYRGWSESRAKEMATKMSPVVANMASDQSAASRFVRSKPSR